MEIRQPKIANVHLLFLNLPRSSGKDPRRQVNRIVSDVKILSRLKLWYRRHQWFHPKPLNLLPILCAHCLMADDPRLLELTLPGLDPVQ